MMIKQHSDLTFKHNLKHGRHGWLRLTPAYSIKIVHRLLDENPDIDRVLDPFSGTGTTGLVCSERSIACDLLDINPFLTWFAKVKTTTYTPDVLATVQSTKDVLLSYVLEKKKNDDIHLWIPPISHIERWWDKKQLLFLAKLHQAIHSFYPTHSPERDLLYIAFCRLLIDSSYASFNHQSLSFGDKNNNGNEALGYDDLIQMFLDTLTVVLSSAYTTLSGSVRVKTTDSRVIPQDTPYNGVITSPPYPNRMSYIRELRPYMYWLGYLTEAREAAELDWQAIGGTWGSATSRLATWKPNGYGITHYGFYDIIAAIKTQSLLLANYVYKYFVDISLHLESLYAILAPEAKIFYVVGNSKFYHVLVPVESIYASILEHVGFVDIHIEVIRKRNSKKELFEFLISARKPA